MRDRMDSAVPEEFRPLKGDASSRRYYRGPEGILVVYPESMAGSFDNFLFWQERYRSIGLPVPEVIEIFPEKRQMLLEDWGDRDGVIHLDGLHDFVARREFVGAVMEIGRAIPQMRDGVAEYRLPPVPVEKELDFMLLHAGETVFSGRDLSWLKQLCGEICTGLERIPAELAHRDFHLRNILVREQQLCVIDFQDTRLAPAGYDVASLLFDNYADLADISGDLFSGLDDPAFRWVALQRSLKALGTFCYFGLKMDKAWFRESIRPALKHVRNHLQTLSREYDLEAWEQLMHAAEAVIPEDG